MDLLSILNLAVTLGPMPRAEPNALTDLEKAQRRILLFDRKTARGWSGAKGAPAAFRNV